MHKVEFYHEIPLSYPTKSHRRYYEKQAKRVERFLRRIMQQIEGKGVIKSQCQ